MIKYNYIIKIAVIIVLSISILLLAINRIPHKHIYELFDTNITPLQIILNNEYLYKILKTFNPPFIYKFLPTAKNTPNTFQTNDHITVENYFTSKKIMDSPSLLPSAKDEKIKIEACQFTYNSNKYIINLEKTPIILKNDKKILHNGNLYSKDNNSKDNNSKSIILLVPKTNTEPIRNLKRLKTNLKTNKKFYNKSRLKKDKSHEKYIFNNISIFHKAINTYRKMVWDGFPLFGGPPYNLKMYNNIYPEVRNSRKLIKINKQNAGRLGNYLSNNKSTNNNFSVIINLLPKYYKEHTGDAANFIDILKISNNNKNDNDFSKINRNIFSLVNTLITSYNKNTALLPPSEIFNFKDISIVSINIFTNYTYYSEIKYNTFYTIYEPVVEVKFKYKKDTYIKIYMDTNIILEDDTGDGYDSSPYEQKHKYYNDTQTEFKRYFEIEVTPAAKPAKPTEFILRFCYINNEKKTIKIPFLSFTDP
jgi:hypothetical protein